jgi:ubiquinone/menaquinone biosynthesis C-methylase UbiE
VTRDHFNQAYRLEGFGAQRRYPNEELLRFMGRFYFSVPLADRAAVKILEVGCGSGANLWMIAREGFDAHGLDISVEGLKLCREILASWDSDATLTKGDMTNLPYEDNCFDVVFDIVSSYCLEKQGYAEFLNEVGRVLKPSGRFFSFTPSQNSDCFRLPGASEWIDDSTLESIKNPKSPYYGQAFPFRFVTAAGIQRDLENRGFQIIQNESIGRTYFNQTWYFEFLSTAAELSGSAVSSF